MLDIDTLSDLPDLLAKTLYNAEVAHLPQLSRAEEDQLVEQARSGDEDARVSLVVSCLGYALVHARRMWMLRLPRHDEALDLAQIASLEMVTDLDVALTKRRPVGYLRGIATRAMSLYLTYHGEMIDKPGYSLAYLAKFHIPTVESLDTPVGESKTLTIDLIQMAPPPETGQTRHEPLYEALGKLTPSQRNSIAKRFGVGDYHPDTPTRQVGKSDLAALRKALPDTYTTMWVKPKREE